VFALGLRNGLDNEGEVLVESGDGFERSCCVRGVEDAVFD
jgi:hypothetical protein